jgi:hypothetical protein
MGMSKIRILINTDLNSLKTQQLIEIHTLFIKTYEQTLMKHISEENSNDQFILHAFTIQ